MPRRAARPKPKVKSRSEPDTSIEGITGKSKAATKIARSFQEVLSEGGWPSILGGASKLFGLYALMSLADTGLEGVFDYLDDTDEQALALQREAIEAQREGRGKLLDFFKEEESRTREESEEEQRLGLIQAAGATRIGAEQVLQQSSQDEMDRLAGVVASQHQTEYDLQPLMLALAERASANQPMSPFMGLGLNM